MSTRAPVPALASPIARSLRALKATGWAGFEGLVATLLNDIIGQELLLAKAGLQSGLDMRSSLKNLVLIAVECKRYEASTPFSERELLSEIEAAVTAYPALDCWVLAATRPIYAQEESVLEAACKQRGIEYLTLGCGSEPNVGLLDALCSVQAERALEFLKGSGVSAGQIEEFREATRVIEARPETIARAGELRRQLSVPSLGYSVFRESLNRRLCDDLADKVRCKHRFRCALGPDALPPGVSTVPRPMLRSRLQSLWTEAKGVDSSNVVAVVGDEGDGKSWIVADWVSSLVNAKDAPAIFFIAAREPSSSSIVDVLSTHAHQYAAVRDIQNAKQRLDRWLSNSSERGVVIILDGLNERLDPALWSELVTDTIQKYGSAIFLIITCRRQTWQQNYRPVMLYAPVEIQIGPFDDAEFAVALSALSPESRPPLIELGPLVRRPRYFHSACEYALHLGKC